ncbi:hypothetical protein [Colwellia sp. MB02u-10]|uniref:hypothetical protein n=1 Tax=Colwellia sp. MB02u-10 TaxID=2759828 RepID=UPI001C70BD49|nr:hypothetical protein [Colwellia sp. MB02u-10]
MIEVEEINSLSGFIKALEIAALFGSKVLFRGQSVKRNLLPNVARNDNSKNTVELEKDSLDQMRLLGSDFLSSRDDDYLNAIVNSTASWFKNTLSGLDIKPNGCTLVSVCR